jgi:hypothetical protein
MESLRVFIGRRGFVLRDQSPAGAERRKEMQPLTAAARPGPEFPPASTVRSLRGRLSVPAANN